MVKSKVPFKTNVDQSIRKVTTPTSKRTGENPITKGGIWISRKNRPIKAAVVNPKKEKTRLIVWILKWVVAIPLFAYFLIWLVIMMTDLFNT